MSHTFGFGVADPLSPSPPLGFHRIWVGLEILYNFGPVDPPPPKLHRIWNARQICNNFGFGTSEPPPSSTSPFSFPSRRLRRI